MSVYKTIPTSYASYSSVSSHRYEQPWEYSGGDPDPRSMPPVSSCHSPLSSQPRKKTKVAKENSAYMRSPDAIPQSPPQSRHSSSGYYGGRVPEDHYWYQGHSPRSDHSHGHSRNPSEASTTYSPSYTTAPRPTNRYDQRMSRAEGPHILEEVVHSPHSTNFSDSGSQTHAAAAHAQHLTQHGYESVPWNSEFAGVNAAAAARRAVSELFPELNGEENAYSPVSEADYTYGHDGGNQTSSAQYSQHKGPTNANAEVYSYGPSSYGYGSNHNNTALDQRPRREYLSPGPHSPPVHTCHPYTNQNGYYYSENDPEYFYDSDESEDSEDEEEYECATANSARVMKNSASSPRTYYHDSSASPSAHSVNTSGPGTPSTIKHSSPEIMTASNVDSVPKRPPGGVGRIPKKLAQSATNSEVREPIPATLTAAAMAAAALIITNGNYDERDAELVYLRRMGVSYRNIKARLGLDEAESTLRGRYRSLVKRKEERLRKPVWSEKDIQLLLQAVEPDLQHIKWKQVSEYIVQHEGTYRFGSSTCKKKYLELVKQGRALPLCEAAGASKRRKQRASKKV